MSQLITCQVCETTQENAWYCATCGLPLHVIPAPEAQGGPPEGFEPTRLDDDPFADIDPLPGLELTRHDVVGTVDAEPVPGLEELLELAEPAASSSALLVEIDLLAEIDGAPLPGFEPTREDFERSAAEVRSDRTCPYCGHEQAAGRVCDACGRARERLVRARVSVADDEARVVCRACGGRVKASAQLCSECGQVLRASD